MRQQATTRRARKPGCEGPGDPTERQARVAQLLVSSRCKGRRSSCRETGELVASRSSDFTTSAARDTAPRGQVQPANR